MSKRKSTEERANDVVKRYLDWALQGRKWSRVEHEYVLGAMVHSAIQRAQQATSVAIQLGAQRAQRARLRPPVKFLPFPFTEHRTLRQVDDAGDVA